MELTGIKNPAENHVERACPYQDKWKRKPVGINSKTIVTALHMWYRDDVHAGILHGKSKPERDSTDRTDQIRSMADEL